MIDPELAEKIAEREDQQQVVVLDSKRTRKFTSAQLVAHLKTDMKFTKNGDLEFTLVVPFDFKHLAYPLSDAFGIPLSVDVKVWQPFDEADT